MVILGFLIACGLLVLMGIALVTIFYIPVSILLTFLRRHRQRPKTWGERYQAAKKKEG